MKMRLKFETSTKRQPMGGPSHFLYASSPALFRHRAEFYLAYYDMDYLQVLGSVVQSTFSVFPSFVLGDITQAQAQAQAQVSKPRRSFLGLPGLVCQCMRCRYLSVSIEAAKHVTRNIPG